MSGGDDEKSFAGVMTLARRGFVNLLNFRGRDTRRQFWSFALPVVGVGMFIYMMILIPTMFRQVIGTFSRMEEMARAHPDDWVVTRGPGSVHYSYVGDDPSVIASMLPDFQPIMVGSMLVGLVVIVLLASAVTRRLHDRGHSGGWALIPVLLSAIGAVLMTRQFASMGAMAANPPTAAGMGSFFTGILVSFAVNAAYLASLAALVIQCAQAGRPGPNRYGEPPAA